MDAKKHQFGFRLRLARQQLSFTQEQLAELIDRSVDAVSNIERGLSLPSHQTLRRLSKVLGIPVKELRMWFEEAEPQTSDPERAQLEATANQLMRLFDTATLRIAVEQMLVLSRHLSR